jgi:hypothetical protein
VGFGGRQQNGTSGDRLKGVGYVPCPPSSLPGEQLVLRPHHPHLGEGLPVGFQELESYLLRRPSYSLPHLGGEYSPTTCAMLHHGPWEKTLGIGLVIFFEK